MNFESSTQHTFPSNALNDEQDGSPSQPQFVGWFTNWKDLFHDCQY